MKVPFSQRSLTETSAYQATYQPGYYFSHYQNKLTWQEKSLAIHSPTTDSMSQKTNITAKTTNIQTKIIYIESDSTLLINCDQLTLKVKQTILILNNNQLNLQATNYQLSTPDCIKDISVACQGDRHTCPQYDGHSAHNGGYIQSGDKKVRVNNQPIARHSDIASCHGSLNQIISQINSIQINNRPIAHLNCNTTHQGFVSDSQHNLHIKPKKLAAQTVKAIQKQKSLNILQINLHYFSSEKTAFPVEKHIKIELEHSDMSLITHKQVASATNIKKDDLENLFRLSIFR